MPTGERKSYSFKSVGMSGIEAQDQSTLTKRLTPIGIQTPVQIVDTDGLFKMHTSGLDNIKDNFKNLLLTNHGERVGLYDFGANLKALVFDLGKEDFDSIAIKQISTAVKKYMPFIDLQTFEPFNDPTTERTLAQVGIRIKYAIPKINVTEQFIEVILHAGG